MDEELPVGPWLDADQAAEYCGISGNKLREMRRCWADHHDRSIEKKIGPRGVRFAKHDLDRLLSWFADFEQEPR